MPAWAWAVVSLVGIGGVIMVGLLLGAGALFQGRTSGYPQYAAPAVNPPAVNSPINPLPASPVPEESQAPEPGAGDPPDSPPAAPSDGGTACTNRATLISSTIQEGTIYPSQAAFTQTWILQNTGTCTWTTGYRVVFQAGDQMEAAASVNLPNEVPPNASVMIPVEMTSPIPSGAYGGTWVLQDEAGKTFGVGESGQEPLAVEIIVDKNVMSVPEPPSSPATQETELPARGGGLTPPDSDEDGINDWDEVWFADTFFPVLYFEKDEQATPNTMMRFYQVTPIYKTSPNIWNYPQYQFPEYQGPPGVLITYVMAYEWDYGFPWDPIAYGGHMGDAEMMRIFLVNPRGQPYTWQVAVVIIKRHLDPPSFYYPHELSWVSGSHPAIWVSQDKHGMYVSSTECHGYFLPDIVGQFFGGGWEQCGGGWVMNWPVVEGVDGFNVGERSSHPFAKIPPSSQNLFTSEFAWSDKNESMLPVYQDNVIVDYYDAAQDFCGGFYGAGKCGGGLDEKWWPLPDVTKQAELAFKLSQYADKFYAAVYGPQYEICFYTGDAKNAGTDLHVDVTLMGTAHSQTFYDLDNANDNFERGVYDCFLTGSYPLDEKVTELSLLMYRDTDDDSEWLLEKVTIRDRYSGEFWNFACNCWLDWKSGYDQTIGANTYGPRISLQPDLRP